MILHSNDFNLVSVLVCNYNYGEYLSECLDSIIKQTHRPIQVLFVDDGSNDNSIKIFRTKLKVFRKEGIGVDFFYYPVNGGRIRSLNKAIELSKGRYSTIVDSDDILYDRFVEISKSELDKENANDSKIGFVYTNLVLIDKCGKIISYGISEEFEEEKALFHSYIPESGLTYTQILKDCYPFDSSVRVNTKHHKWQKIIKAGWKGKLIHLRLFKYRMHEKNISGIGNRITSPRTKLIDKWNPHKTS